MLHDANGTRMFEHRARIVTLVLSPSAAASSPFFIEHELCRGRRANCVRHDDDDAGIVCAT